VEEREKKRRAIHRRNARRILSHTQVIEDQEVAIFQVLEGGINVWDFDTPGRESFMINCDVSRLNSTRYVRIAGFSTSLAFLLHSSTAEHAAQTKPAINAASGNEFERPAAFLDGQPSGHRRL
jgi:hypothetical protein